jgi:O-antigen/teichoic acid export membrane protein
LGIVQRESIGTFIIEFLGLLIGFASILFIYPLSDEGFGYAQFILNSSILLVPFMGLGIANAVIKYYPETFDREGRQNNLILFSVVLTALTSLLLILIVELFSGPLSIFLMKMDFNVALMRENKIVILGLGYVLVLVNTLIAYISNFGKIAAPYLIKELGIKIFLPLVILAFYYNYIVLESISLLLIAFYTFVLLGLLIYSLKRNILQLSFRKSILPYFKLKGLFPYLSFTSLTSLSSILAFRIDLIMIAPLLSLSENGVYAKILIISAVLEIPLRIFTKTTSPTLAKYWFQNNHQEIQKVYRSTSNNSLVLASFLWLLLIFNLDQIFAISSNPSSFAMGFQIFLVLSISKIIGVISGIGNTIISFSPSYKYNLYFLVFLGVFNIILNYIFILEYGIIGAAYATVISTVAFHALKVLLLFSKYKIHPFSVNMLKTIAVSLTVFGVLFLIPVIENNYFNIILRSAIISLVFIPLILYFKVSQDLNSLVSQYYTKLKTYL